jgi:hypothetical protein
MRARILVLSLMVASCDPATRNAGDEQPTKPEPTQPEPAVREEPVVIVEPPPARTPPPPVITFDTATATEAKVRVLVVHDDNWGACGIFHWTGAITVEVLDVGEPAPRMVLIVSCPGDLNRHLRLEVGAILQVKLYARRQSWPTPPSVRKLPKELPRRYMKTGTRVDISPTSPASGPAPQSDAAPE